jgi:NAD(P)-dependent dehydrogenase (short-subunit alcohol dehydrogenase family)
MTMRGLKDKVTIVACAAPGNIGGLTALRLAEEGSAVVAADLNEAAARSVVDEIRAFGGVMPRHPVPANGARRQTMPGRTGAREEQMA